MSTIEEGLLYILSTVGALLPIVNPLSAVGLVVGITQELTEAERRQQIARACIYMFGILTAFLVAGGVIMSFFGISIPGLRIAGGLIVGYIGFRMLFPDTSGISRQERDEAAHKPDVSFTPLAMPMLSGPGSIGVVVGIASTAQDGDHVVLNYALVAMGIAVTALISYVVLRAATRLNQVLGATGMNAIARLMGFLLVCIGVQFVINGIGDVVQRNFQA
ncbi:MAG TPA: MarC family NAAT transporter [Gammaproteobacteria bacterium]|nr:MarC family NAAT transporter [Gammaproteobacteria bacterium]